MRLAILILCSTLVLAAPDPKRITGRVVSITDGDTIKVLVDQRQVKVLLWGIDTPERRQDFGNRARELTGELVHEKTVTVIVRDIDRYGRTVGEVILPDGRNLGHELVRAGVAWWYERYAPKDRELERLQAEARAAKRGCGRIPARSRRGSGADCRRRKPVRGTGSGVGCWRGEA